MQYNEVSITGKSILLSNLIAIEMDHRVYSVIEFIAENYRAENFYLNNLKWNFTEMTMNGNKVIPENLVIVH